MKGRKRVICVANDGYEASLQRSKVYVLIPDRPSEKVGFLRVIDESGGAYLYPRAFFRPVSRLENDPRFLRRIEQARKSIRSDRGVPIEDV